MGTLCHISSSNYGNADKLLAPVEVYAFRAYRCFLENSIQLCENARNTLPANQRAVTKSLRNLSLNMFVVVAKISRRYKSTHISSNVIFNQKSSKSFDRCTCLPSIPYDLTFGGLTNLFHSSIFSGYL